MIKKKYKKFTSSNGINEINTVIWKQNSEKYPEPLAILQIAHGMIDYVERYDELACFMAEKGFLVVGNDHLGHGGSVKGADDLGYFADDNDPGKYVVQDMHKLTSIMKAKYPDVPYFLLGHSMGSFMVRRYLSSYGYELTGTIILGTGNQPWALVDGGRLIVEAAKIFKGDRYRSEFINKLMFGSYNKRIKDSTKEHDWLATDEKVVDAYEADELCDYKFTVNGYKGLLNTIAYVKRYKNIKKIPRELPVLLASGLEDPVGNYGKDVKRLFNTYRRHFNEVELRLYEDCRHELHNELIKEDVFEDIYKWMLDIIW